MRREFLESGWNGYWYYIHQRCGTGTRGDRRAEDQVDSGSKDGEKYWVSCIRPGVGAHAGRRGIRRKDKCLLDELLDRYPDVKQIGLTGQMHGIVYLDQEGSCVSPLYTWQDGRGDISIPGEKSLVEEIRKTCGISVSSGYGLLRIFTICGIIWFPNKRYVLQQ